MNRIQILDCTLRDGGYCNDWRFGFENIKKITNGLIEADIDIVECGFVSNRVSYDPDNTRFSSVDEISKVIPHKRLGKTFVAMINYGEYSADDLPPYDGTSVDGIRVAFHKKDLFNALDLCEKIKEKGYLVFVQAMVSLSYTDEEFLTTIHRVNEFKPYAFYIVDSFGMMKNKDLTRLFYMVEHNLNPEIWIGFHSHNNMQLAYSNAQQLTRVQTNRNLIIDSSIYGMGRGAGNLNTELFVEYLNENANKNYQLKPLLILIDEILNGFYQKNYWGYSLPNYISAAHNAHPNYASFLDDKKTLTIDDINEIFEMMDEDKKVSFDKSYVEKLYLKYMEEGKSQSEHEQEIKEKFAGKKILLVAPGKSSVDESKLISDFVRKNDALVVSVNHEYKVIATDFIFVSNIRRFRELDEKSKSKCVVTSNIRANGVYFRANYKELLNSEEAVTDNAGLMAIKFLTTLGGASIYLAGFDGYSHDASENYGNSEMELITRNTILDAMNIGMSKVLKEYSKNTELYFLTKPRFVHL